MPLPLKANSCVYPSEDLHRLGLCVKGEAMSGKQISAVGGQYESQHLWDDSPSSFLAGPINSRARPLPAVSYDLGKHFLDGLEVASSTWQPIILYERWRDPQSLMRVMFLSSFNDYSVELLLWIMYYPLLYFNPLNYSQMRNIIFFFFFKEKGRISKRCFRMFRWEHSFTLSD